MSSRQESIQKLIEILKDYRKGEIESRSEKLINEWVSQFPSRIQDDLLSGLAGVLSKTYISKESFQGFLRGLSQSTKLAGKNSPEAFWRDANILSIQQGGRSQTEINRMFGDVLESVHGFGLNGTGSKEGTYVYLDDCVGTGNRVRNDLSNWIEKSAPERSIVHVITPILFQGSYWIDAKIKEKAKECGKSIELHKWRLDRFEMENRLTYRDNSDILWPNTMPDEATEYGERLKERGHPAVLRSGQSVGSSNLFDTHSQRVAIEQALLIRGCEIRNENTNLPETHRPLGFQNLDSLGFGSLFVTYRNCPNNCPLALWVDQREFPALLPRKNN